MKIVSVVFFAAALILTWGMSRNKPAVSEAMHLSIQNELKDVITEYVQRSLPDANNLRFEKFWTETLKPGKVKAVFTYTFQDASNGLDVKMEINGVAILNKVAETPENLTWSMDELHIQDNEVNFQDPIHITAGSNDQKKENE